LPAAGTCREVLVRWLNAWHNSLHSISVFQKVQSWFEAPADPKQEDWIEHIVENDLETVQHFVGVADINLDGTLDIASAAMHQGTPPQEVKVYLNQGKPRLVHLSEGGMRCTIHTKKATTLS
jgi:hypothetical protein